MGLATFFPSSDGAVAVWRLRAQSRTVRLELLVQGQRATDSATASGSEHRHTRSLSSHRRRLSVRDDDCLIPLVPVMRTRVAASMSIG